MLLRNKTLQNSNPYNIQLSLDAFHSIKGCHILIIFPYIFVTSLVAYIKAFCCFCSDLWKRLGQYFHLLNCVCAWKGSQAEFKRQIFFVKIYKNGWNRPLQLYSTTKKPDFILQLQKLFYALKANFLTSLKKF